MVCLTGVGRTNAIHCDGCECWVHKKCSGIIGRLLHESEFTCARCLGTARAIDGRHSSKSSKLSQSSATLGICSLQEVAVSQACAALAG